MTNVIHKLDGQTISEPRNWREIEMEKDFLNRHEEASLNISRLEFAGSVAKTIKERAFNGLNGGLGIFEGSTYDIEIGDIGNPTFTFKGYLDYSDSIEVIGTNEISVALKKRKGTDWINDVADSFSFRYLYDKGVINDSDFVKIPYIINYIPDGIELLLLGVSLFTVTKELISSIKNTSDAIADVTDASIPVVGVGAGAGAVVVTAWDIGNFVMAIIKAVVLIAYQIAMLYAIKELIQQIFDQLMPKKRFHLGMRLETLFIRACEHKGLTFQSNLISNEYSDWVIIPSKGHKGGKKPTGWKGTFNEVGVPSVNDPFDTFGDLIRVWSSVLYADYSIDNNIFKFERIGAFDSTSTYVIPDTFTDQDKLIDRAYLNTDEIVSNYFIKWGYDTQDQNTLDNQIGRVFQVITEPNTINNKDLVTLKNLNEIQIPCSLGIDKTELTTIEKTLKGLGNVVDKITGIFGGGTSFSSKIEARVGSLLLSSDFITIPKVVVMSGSKLKKDQRKYLSAKALWDKSHYLSSPTEINGTHNQWYRLKGVKVPFCLENAITLLGDNNCKTSSGEIAKIEKFKWNSWGNFAMIDYRINKKYTNNLKITTVE